MVREAAGHISSTQNPTQADMALSSARTRDNAVCVTMPGEGSANILLVMAWRRKRRVLVSERLMVLAISEKVAVLWMGKDFAGFVSLASGAGMR